MTPKKDALIETAGELFYHQGYGATGVKQIIDEAGIAKGTFYSHFLSKEEIGIAWLRKRHHQWGETLAATLEKAGTPRAKILALFEFLEGWMGDNRYRGCAFLNSLAELPQPESGMRAVIREHKDGIRKTFVELSRAHFKGKSKSYAEHKGSVLFLLFEAAIVESQNFQDPWPIGVVRKEVGSILQGS